MTAWERALRDFRLAIFTRRRDLIAAQAGLDPDGPESEQVDAQLDQLSAIEEALT